MQPIHHKLKNICICKHIDVCICVCWELPDAVCIDMVCANFCTLCLSRDLTWLLVSELIWVAWYADIPGLGQILQDLSLAYHEQEVPCREESRLSWQQFIAHAAGLMSSTPHPSGVNSSLDCVMATSCIWGMHMSLFTWVLQYMGHFSEQDSVIAHMHCTAKTNAGNLCYSSLQLCSLHNLCLLSEFVVLQTSPISARQWWRWHACVLINITKTSQ